MKISSSVMVFSTQHLATGGIESHLQEFCLHLASSGAQLDLVITNSKMHPETEAFFRKICKRVYLGTYTSSYLRVLWLLQIGVKLCFQKYNALYTNGQGESVLFFQKLIKYKIWIHHHHTSGDNLDQATWGRHYRKTLQQAHTLIACSNRNAVEMTKALNRNIIVIPCFSRNAFSKLRPVSKMIRLGYFGRLIPEKGIDLICLLSQESAFNNVEFHLWGEGDCYPSSFFTNFERVNYHHSFKGTGGLVKAVSSIDAFLLLSTHPEGLPICLLEVMSAGLPWLATDRGGISDIAIDPVSTRVISSSLDYNQIKDAVCSLVEDIRTGMTSETAQRELYIKNFSASALLNQWRNILELTATD